MSKLYKMEQKTVSKEGYQALLNKSFDVAEAPIRNWISYYTQLSTTTLFERKIDKADSVWIHPTNKKEKYIEFKIRTVPNDYKLELNELDTQKVRDVIQFLAFSINTVYEQTVNLLNSNYNDIQNIHMEWNINKYLAEPKYKPPPIKALDKHKLLINHHLSYKDNVMRTASDEKKEEWKDDYKKLVDDLDILKLKATPLNELVNEKNKYLSSCKKIGIIINTYKESELPKSMFMENLPKINAPSYK